MMIAAFKLEYSKMELVVMKILELTNIADLRKTYPCVTL
ncbi:MAG: hypothetical protein JWQ78_951 [Sediminibacterium sp.]|nr:hypothetical protein [Sediminibacterium sp.]